MSQNNILGFLNKGIKALLFETIIKLQQTDFAGGPEVEKALENVYTLNFLLHTIWDSEQKHIWSIVEKHQPGVVESIAKERALIRGSLLKLEEVIFECSHSNSDNICWVSNKVLHSVILHCISFIEKREEVLNNLLSTSGAQETGGHFWHWILADLSKEEIALLSKWMITGLNLREIIHCLKVTGENSSRENFSWMLQAAENEMENTRWKQVQDALAEGALHE